MANGATLPPWLNIDPLAGVPTFLQGFGQGARIGEGRRQAEAQAYEAQLQQSAAQERNEILREAKQIQAQEFAENLKLKQETAQRAARTAAIRLEGQQGLERDIQAGMPFEEALPRHASKLFHDEPQALTQLLRQVQPKTFAPSELERSMEYALGKGFITAEEAPALAREHFLGPTESTEVTQDEQGRPSVKITKGRGTAAKDLAAPTTAFQTRLQEQLHSHDSSMAILDHVEKNMNASDFGLRGMAKELRSRVGGQFGLNVDPRDLDVRNSLKQLRQDLSKSLRSDSNINKDEREQIVGMLPAVEMFDVIESLPDAVGKLLTVKRTLQQRSRTAAQKLGVLPPLWTLSNEEIANAVKGKQLNYNEALEFLKANR